MPERQCTSTLCDAASSSPPDEAAKEQTMRDELARKASKT
jgi:hypothetical protein